MATETYKNGQGIDYVTQINAKKVPFQLRLFQRVIKTTNTISPALARRLILCIFMTPKKIHLNEEQLQFYNVGDTWKQSLQGKDVFFFQYGIFPKLLLVHGWGSSNYRFRRFMEYLIEQDISFMTLDLPAHGQSSGKRTNLFEVGNVLEDVFQLYPTLNTVVGHSFGGSATYSILHRVPEIKKVVSIASPSNFDSIVDPFFELLDIPATLKKPFLDTLAGIMQWPKSDFHFVYRDFSFIKRMVIHDRDDEIIHPRNAKELANGDPTVPIIYTAKLGHRGILKDEKILEMIVSFI